MRLALLRDNLSHPVDGASLAAFRVAIGGSLLWEVIKYAQHGKVYEYWAEPLVHFAYVGFTWVRPWPAPLLFAHWILLGTAALCIAIGYHYRIACWVAMLSFGYFFLLEATRYLNHYYALWLFLLLLSCVPADACCSVSSLRIRPGFQQEVPKWSVWLLRFQVGIIYVYGGFAKMQPDWIAGTPIAGWVRQRNDLELVRFIVDRHAEVPVFAWGGMIFDLLIVPGLLFRKTRVAAFAAVVCFHLVNSSLFAIGVFPWLMIGATTIFFSYDWPRNLLGGMAARRHSLSAVGEKWSYLLPSWSAFLIGVYIGVQCLLPMRERLYPGNVLWTEEGQTFSWRMMLREKEGITQMRVVTRDKTFEVTLDEYLRPWQAQAVAITPAFILQFAHYLASEYQRRGYKDVRVYCDSWLSLNGRPRQLMIDPEVDLARQPLTARPASWIVPLAM